MEAVKPDKPSERRTNSYYTTCHRAPSGLTRQNSIFHYRKRVPSDVRSHIKKGELWRSLKTDSYSVATRRLHRAAAEIEAEFEAARLHLRLTVDLTLLPSLADGSTGATFVGKLEEHLVTLIEKARLPAPSQQPTLGEVYGLYLADPRHDWCERTKQSYQTTRKWVLEFFGAGTRIDAITREACRQFVELLRAMPKHADKRFPEKSAREAAEIASCNPAVVRISAANVNAYLVRLCALMNWAVEEGYILTNPARGLRIPDPVNRRDKRLAFSDAQLTQIFHSALYVGDRNNGLAGACTGHQRRARFWVPLIGLFSGMRLNEICQLDVADVGLHDGILCMRVTGRSEQDGQTKRIKTAASERLIPIHSELRAIGFIAYLDERRRSGDAELFPELTLGRLGYRSISMSRWFSRFLMNIGAARSRTCFHSLRHNFRDALREARVEREVALLLGGWASGSDRAGVADNYGSGPRPATLEAELNKVAYSGLNLAHLHMSE